MQLTNPLWNADYNIFHDFLGFLLKQKTDGRELPEFPFCSSIVWAQDEQAIIGATMAGKIVKFPLVGDEQQTLFELGEPLHSLTWDDSKTRLIAGGKSGKLYLLDIADNGKRTVKIGDSSINVIQPLPNSDFVAVGSRGGRVAIVDTTTAEIVAKIELKRRIWDLLPAGDRDGRQHIYVASLGNRIRLLEFSAADKQLSVNEQGTIAIDDETLSAVQSLDLDQENRLLALDDTNRVWVLSLDERGSVKFATEVLGRNDQRNALLAKLHDEKIAIPDPFERVGTVRWLPDSKAGFSVAGINSAVGIYQLAENPTRPYFRILQTNVGGAATIMFDGREAYLLWVLRRDGQLSLVDVMSDKEIDRREAHQGESYGIVSLGDEGTVATAGGDGAVRFWKQAKGKIVEVKRVAFERHDHGLISLAYDPNKERLAAVDERANLLIWDAATGREYAKLALNENPGRPFTGKLAFNCDGTRLIAFGVEQSAHVFTFDPPQRLPEQPNMGSLGGSAVCWSPTHPQKFIVADYYTPKAFQYGEKLNEFRDDLRRSLGRSICVAAASTSDDRRVVLLEQNGVIRFFDTEAMIPVFDFRSTLMECVDLSFNKSNDLFAVVDELGELEITDVAYERPRPNQERWRIMENEGWRKVRLFDSEHRVFTSEKAICFDANGLIHLLVVENRAFAGPAEEPADFRECGALHYVRENVAGTGVGEQLRVDETINDRQIDYSTLDLELTNKDRPVAVFRRRVPSTESNYTGDTLLAVRGQDEKWGFEPIVKTANMGFFPLIDMDEDGNVRAVFHDSQATYNLVRSTRGEESALQWDHQVIGLHGDGLHLQGVRNQDSVRFISTRYRFGGDIGRRSTGTWQDEKLQRLELGTKVKDCRIRDDGQIFALSEEAQGRKHWVALNQWDEDHWKPIKELPADFRDGLTDFRVDRQGRILALYWDEANKQLWFVSETKAEFRAVLVAADEQPTGHPFIFCLLLDTADRPVVIVTTSAEENGYVEVYRTQDR